LPRDARFLAGFTLKAKSLKECESTQMNDVNEMFVYVCVCGCASL
jgi:hypothetical protein